MTEIFAEWKVAQTADDGNIRALKKNTYNKAIGTG